MKISIAQHAFVIFIAFLHICKIHASQNDIPASHTTTKRWGFKPLEEIEWIKKAQEAAAIAQKYQRKLEALEAEELENFAKSLLCTEDPESISLAPKKIKGTYVFSPTGLVPIPNQQKTGTTQIHVFHPAFTPLHALHLPLEK